MLPIATVQGVKNGISTGMIIDLSDYLKKTEGVTKDEFTSLENTVSGKLDTEPQHKHDISDVKNLREALDGKYDTSKKYAHNVILSDVEKIAYIEAPKVQHLEVAMNSTIDGYNFYVDDSNGDLMILSPASVLIASYSLASNSWTFGGISLKDVANSSTVAEHKQLIQENSINIVAADAKINAVQASLDEYIAKTDAVLKNHYDALMLLLEKHDMVDSNTGDGSNVSPA